MIYLIKASYYDEKTCKPALLLKIGYAKNIDDRMKTYKTHNPLVQLLDTREGDYELENELHYYFKEYAYPDQPEWFYYNERIIQEFNTYERGNIYDSIEKERVIKKIKEFLTPRIIKTDYIYDLLSKELTIPDEDIDCVKSSISQTIELFRSTIESSIDKIDFSVLPNKVNINQVVLCIETNDKTISLDLPQIVGRQRNKNNQFKNNIVIFYKTLRKDEVYTKDDFDKLQKEREKQTYDMIDVYTSVNESKQKGLKTKFLSDIKVSKYAEDYVSFSKKTGLPVYNKLIEVANERAWEVSQKDYQDSINVTRAIKNAGFDQEVYKDRDNTIISEFLNNFNSLVNFEERMKAYCEFRDKNLGNKNLENRLHYKITSNYGDDNKFENYYNFYGTSGCKARSYKEANLKTGISDKSKDIILIKEIFSIFSVGDKLAKNQIKEMLKCIYIKLDIKSTPKASDLEQYFNLRAIKVKDSSGKWVNGFEIVKKK